MDQCATLVNVQIPPWLTKAYLEEVLRNNHDDPRLEVKSFEVRSPATNVDNYASCIHKIAVTYCADGDDRAKKLLIAKTLPTGETVQGFIKDMRFFEREMLAYTRLIPAMQDLSAAPITSPKLFATGRPYTVILEDMTPRGFKMADRMKRLDLAHSFLALKTLARFHALAYAVVQRDPDIIDLVAEDNGRNDAQDQFFTKLYECLASVVEKWPGYERFSEKILQSNGEIQMKVEECSVIKKGAFQTINHGDFWVNNMLFQYNEETKDVEDMCMIDLQLMRYASPAKDLHYFLSSSLADGIREHHEDSLLQVYHQSLTQTLETVGECSGIYSLEDLKKDFKDYAPSGFQFSILVIGAVTADPQEALDFDNIFGETLKDGSSSSLEKVFSGERFKHVFKKHLLCYEKHGVL